MKIAWITHPTEIESDLIRAAEDSGDELMVYSVGNDLGGHSRIPVQDKTGLDGHVGWAILDLFERARAWNPDLTVIRFPFWLTQQGIADRAQRIMEGQKAVVYSSEQGPTRHMAMLHCHGWKHLAVNCRADEAVYRLEFPDAKIHYLPFGCVLHRDDELVGDPRYEHDVISDGWAHYECKCYGGWKGHSVRTMIMPLLAHFDLGLYGRADKDAYIHSWLPVPGCAEHYRGLFPSQDYPKVYRACKVYVGAAWCWAHGGYGVRFARLLSTGTATIWHRTVWAEQDGIYDGEQVLFADNPAEVVTKTRYLLEHPDERRALGDRARAWVTSQWGWMTNLYRLADEL